MHKQWSIPIRRAFLGERQTLGKHAFYLIALHTLFICCGKSWTAFACFYTLDKINSLFSNFYVIREEEARGSEFLPKPSVSWN